MERIYIAVNHSNIAIFMQTIFTGQLLLPHKLFVSCCVMWMVKAVDCNQSQSGGSLESWFLKYFDII